jgi:hypothetical protein
MSDPFGVDGGDRRAARQTYDLSGSGVKILRNYSDYI